MPFQEQSPRSFNPDRDPAGGPASLRGEVIVRGQRYASAEGPIYRALWEEAMPVDLFAAAPAQFTPAASKVASSSLALLRQAAAGGALHSESGRLSANIVRELGEAGYWGFILPAEFGGSGATYRELALLLGEVATIEPSLANLLSVHSCLGAAAAVHHFGSGQQQRMWLPPFARGERQSVFALTEPAAGSDLSAVRTVAHRNGDRLLLSGTKVFITSLGPNRIAAVICVVDGRPAVLLVDLPAEESPELKYVDYALHVASRSGNRGVAFRDFAVPAENLIVSEAGNGLAVAYFGLNRGRMSLCATAGGTIRRLLAQLLPWVRSRQTFGLPIGSRQLVQQRIGRLASLAVGCETLAAWCATLFDRGYRGESEAMVAKIFAADALHEAAIDIGLRTFGGRSFLRGNPIGDSLHDLLAPTIYEGEGDILSLALLKSLLKGVTTADSAATLNGPSADESPAFPADGFRIASRHLRSLVERFGHSALDEQCEAIEISRQIQRLAALACLTCNQAQLSDPISAEAANCLARRLRAAIENRSASADELRLEAQLGQAILGLEGSAGWSRLEGIPVQPLPSFRDPFAQGD
jgi:alkylation response protein AidB-like acyl-CoA dehydrogenase